MQPTPGRGLLQPNPRSNRNTMLATFYGALIGATLGAIPGILLFVTDREKFWAIKLIFVLIAGTAAIVGAIAGSTAAILATFKRHRKGSGGGEKTITLTTHSGSPPALDT